jgi:hypothetical protein
LHIEGKNADSVKVFWQEFPNPSELKWYYVWLQATTNLANGHFKRKSTEPSFNWTGLDSGIQYEIGVSVVSHNFGESERSETKTFTTDELNESDKSAVEKLQTEVVRKI